MSPESSSSLSGLVGTLGTKYVFRLAAYVDNYELLVTEGNKIDLRGFDLEPLPPTIRRNLSALDHEVSIDLIATKGESEFFVEAKHAEEPRPVTINSPEFKEALVEFVSLTKYAKGSFRDVRCLFVTNAPVRSLQKQLNNFRLEPAQELGNYAKRITIAARKKWKGVTKQVSAFQLKNALARVFVVRVADASIDSVANREVFIS